MNLKVAFQIMFNIIAQSVGKIISVGLSFVSIALLTRYLGLEGYGNYTLIFSYLAFFTLIGDFGLQIIAVKELASASNNIESYYGSYFLLRFGLVLLSCILAFFFLFFFPYSLSLKGGIIIGILAIGISGVTGYFNTLLQAKVRLDLLTLVDLIGKIGSVLTIVLFVFLKLNFYFIVSAVLIGNFISFVTGFILMPNTIHTSFDFKIVQRLFLQAIPVGITSLLSTLYFKVDTIILSLLKSSADVGIYTLAYKMLENITLFWFFYVGTVYPILAKLRKENNLKYESMFKHSTLIGFVTSILVIMISYILAPIVVKIFGGDYFNNSVVVLRILLFSLPFIFINTLFYNLYILEEFNIVVIVGMLSSLVFNIVLNVVFIPHYSYIASSYITVLSEVILFISYLIGLKFIKKTKPL